MRFGSSIVTACMALAATVSAQTADFDPITAPASNEVITAGTTYPVAWQVPAKYKNDKIIISLIGGATQTTQIPIQDIASGVANSAATYEWKVPATLGDAAVYGLVFKVESDPSIFQYSNPFHIKKATGGSSTTATGSAEGTTTVTTFVGVKTVTLSKCTTSTTSSTTTTATPKSIYTPTQTPVKPSSTAVVYSTPAAPPPSTIITVVGSTAAPSTVAPPSQPTQPSQPIPTPNAPSAASHFASAPIAIIAAIAMALFTL